MSGWTIPDTTKASLWYLIHDRRTQPPSIQDKSPYVANRQAAQTSISMMTDGRVEWGMCGFSGSFSCFSLHNNILREHHLQYLSKSAELLLRRSQKLWYSIALILLNFSILIMFLHGGLVGMFSLSEYPGEESGSTVFQGSCSFMSFSCCSIVGYLSSDDTSR